MKVTLDDEDKVFVTSDSSVIFIEQLVELEEQVSIDYPQIEILKNFWDVSFEYYYVNRERGLIDVYLVLSDKTRSISLKPPDFLSADYFIHDEIVIPIRKYEYELLRNFLPTLDHDGILGLTIKELMNFDYFVSSNSFDIEMSELKDEVLASSQIDTGQFESVLAVTPYPYQAIGIEWLRSLQSLGRKGAILGDVMGLGKTLQAIGLLTHNVQEGKLDNLVICPGTLVENWKREITKFSPDMGVYVHFGPMRAGISEKLRDHDVVITSYDCLVADHSVLSDVNWNVLIIDEAQAIKNPRAKRTIRCKELPRNFGLAITGTPLENRLMDLWSLSDFAEPGIFGSQSSFEALYEDSPTGASEVGKIIRPILLRRRLDEIEHQLPDKIVLNHPLQWPEELCDVYEKVRIEAIQEFAQAGGLVATGRLRKLTTHPLMMDIDSENMTMLSPKYALTVEIIEELFASGEKCLVFASYMKIIDRMRTDLENRFQNSFIQSLDGRTAMDSRDSLVNEFNLFPGSGVLICNPIVAGAGLNITGANHVIHYNLEWNPAKEDQATFRVYRHGQMKKTFIHRLFYIDTIDEVIDERIELKRNLSDLSVDFTTSNEELFAGLQVSPLRSYEN
jgi:SNF2 family DNA or RNA helicase